MIGDRIIPIETFWRGSGLFSKNIEYSIDGIETDEGIESFIIFNKDAFYGFSKEELNDLFILKKIKQRKIKLNKI